MKRENANSPDEDENESKRKACSRCTREDLEQAGKVPTVVGKKKKEKKDKETNVGFQVGCRFGICLKKCVTGSKDKTANTEGRQLATESPKIKRKLFGFYPQGDLRVIRKNHPSMNTNSSVLRFSLGKEHDQVVCCEM